ncbi:MAG: RNA-binding protein [Planctomycetota bacterium]|nr:RNA-binding protein [Planctomycetota bacterium]
MFNIYVGNLSFDTSEGDLREAFEEHGQVIKSSIVTDRDTGRSRGFGFVEMESNEDGKKAIAALNESDLGGRKLTVNEAKPREPRSGGGGGGGGGRRGGGGGGGGYGGGGGGGGGRW